MIVLFNNGPLSGKFATINAPAAQQDIRVRYLKDGNVFTAAYAINERVAAATKHVFAAATYLGDMETPDSMVDYWDYPRQHPGPKDE